MKNENLDEPKDYIERNMVLVFAVLIAGISLLIISAMMLIKTNPWGTLVAVPGLIFTLQGLWLLVNPYAVIYEDRFDLKQSLLFNREFYYLDAKDIVHKNNLHFNMIYNDGDIFRLPIFGIKNSHKKLLLNKLKQKIAESMEKRDFK